ncbi:MAG: hypothetical protein V1773_07940 [bacterium]
MILKILLSWFCIMAIAIINGALRDLLYKNKLGKKRADQISTFSLLLLISIFTFFFQRLFPLSSLNESIIIGVYWFVFTEIFEFLAGHYIFKKTWHELIISYDLFNGQLWILIPIWMAVINLVIYKAIN